jgi:hypothetical protein
MMLLHREHTKRDRSLVQVSALVFAQVEVVRAWL